MNSGGQTEIVDVGDRASVGRDGQAVEDSGATLRGGSADVEDGGEPLVATVSVRDRVGHVEKVAAGGPHQNVRGRDERGKLCLKREVRLVVPHFVLVADHGVGGRDVGGRRVDRQGVGGDVLVGVELIVLVDLRALLVGADAGGRIDRYEGGVAVGGAVLRVHVDEHSVHARRVCGSGVEGAPGPQAGEDKRC